MVGHAAEAGAVVTGGRHRDYPFLHGMERPDRDAVLHVARGGAADGDGDNVDPVIDGGLEGCQDVHVGAAGMGPADLVDRHPSSWHGPSGGAFREAEEVGTGDGVPGEGRGGMSPVAVDVDGREDIPQGWGSVQLEVSRSDDLAAGRENRAVDRSNTCCCHSPNLRRAP